MAKKSLIIKAKKDPKFSTRSYNRCRICGRPRGYVQNLLQKAGQRRPDPWRNQVELVGVKYGS